MTTTVVRIGGAQVDSTVLAGISIRYGRQDLDSQVPASTCSLSLWAKDTTPLAVNLRDLVTVDVDGTRVFYGKVTDRTVDLDYVTSTGAGTVQQVIATGALADLGRVTVGTVAYPQELDGGRAQRVVVEAAPVAATIDSITTLINQTSYAYDYFLAAGYDTFDNGTVSVLSRAAEPATPATLTNTDISAPGIYETPDGKIGYSDAYRRIRLTSSITIPASVIVANLTLRGGIGDLVNTASVSYGSANPQDSLTATNIESINRFGTLAKTYQTQLANAADAQDAANRLVTTRGTGELNIDSLLIELENPSLDPTLRAALLAPKFGTAITVTGLDERFGLGTTWRGFIEGWSVGIGLNQYRIQLNVSARKFSLPLGTLDKIVVPLNNLTGTLDDLAVLWAPEPNIDGAGSLIDVATGTYDTAYLVS